MEQYVINDIQQLCFYLQKEYKGTSDNIEDRKREGEKKNKKKSTKTMLKIHIWLLESMNHKNGH